MSGSQLSPKVTTPKGAWRDPVTILYYRKIIDTTKYGK
jgi:hypothetical protein